MIVSIQGYRGSFHHIVAQNVFGKEIQLLERDTFREVFDDTLEKRVDFGIAALENSIAGSIHETYDLLLKKDVYMIGEFYLRIAQQLIAFPETKIEDITEVLSHPMAIRQCYDFLAKYPAWKVLEEPDTAGSVAKIKHEGRKNSAAIASNLAAEVYGMQIIAPDIETDKQNYTRFAILSDKKHFPTDADKTSLVCSVKHTPGSLAGLLNMIAGFGVNLSKIESRPIVGKAWEYYFYIDFEAGMEQEAGKKILENMKDHCDMVRVLGSYKKGEL